MPEKIVPRVGIGCWVFNPDGLVLMGKRLSEHGHGTWAVPGGHLELGEEPQHAAKRELFEETDIEIPENEFILFAVTNDLFHDDNNILQKHYITLHYAAYGISDSPKIMEPDKCEKWLWFKMHALPAPLFLPTQNALAQIQAYR